LDQCKKFKRLGVNSSELSRVKMRETEVKEAIEYLKACDGFILQTYRNDAKGRPTDFTLKVCQSVLANLLYVTRYAVKVREEVDKLLELTFRGIAEDGVDVPAFIAYCEDILKDFSEKEEEHGED